MSFRCRVAAVIIAQHHNIATNWQVSQQIIIGEKKERNNYEREEDGESEDEEVARRVQIDKLHIRQSLIDRDGGVGDVSSRWSV